MKASKLFERHLGKHFDPLKHWTSSLRTRAGLPAPEKSSGKAAFTIAGAHALAVTKLLITQGYSQAEIWKDMKPTYHFEVAASAGDADSTFIWSTGELKRVSGALGSNIMELSSLPVKLEVTRRSSFNVDIDSKIPTTH